MTGIFGVVKAVMTFVWLLFLVDQLGRRKLLLIGGITGSICMWVLGAYIYVVDPTKNPQDHLTGSGIAAIVFFYLWTAVYTPTWNGTPWVINSVSLSTVSVFISTNNKSRNSLTQVSVLLLKLARPLVIGSSISSCHGSLSKCLRQWATAYTCSSLRSHSLRSSLPFS